MRNWLQDFAYRTSLGMLTFVLTMVLALIIALLTVSFQAVKAAVANPVDALKYE
jgi:ABC-type lipoprotein release transport system permease subunit